MSMLARISLVDIFQQYRQIPFAWLMWESFDGLTRQTLHHRSPLLSSNFRMGSIAHRLCTSYRERQAKGSSAAGASSVGLKATHRRSSTYTASHGDNLGPSTLTSNESATCELGYMPLPETFSDKPSVFILGLALGGCKLGQDIIGVHPGILCLSDENTVAAPGVAVQLFNGGEDFGSHGV